MPLLRVYIALSLDGYIADQEGGVSWLDPYFTREVDFGAFQRSIGATVMGRRTYDQASERGSWAYGGQPVVVLTHRPIGPNGPIGPIGKGKKAPKGVEAYSGDLGELAARLRGDLEGSGKDVWLIGGGESIRAFHEADLVDRWELFWIPVTLGRGIPLFPPAEGATSRLRPTRSRTYANGIVELHYEPLRE